jgi:histidinol-phosphate aminotransferase
MTDVAPLEAGLRLHLNENTAGCSPAVLAALRAITRADAACYPDYRAITAKVEGWFGVPPGWVQLTNGLDEGLHVAAQAAARGGPGASALIVDPAFEMYAACADAAGLTAVHVAPRADLEFPLEDVLAALGPATRLVNLTDPNNPTGRPIPPGAIEQIALAVPDALVLVDEAYAEFSGRTCIGPLLGRRRNVVVGRTFAKAHGLAALRVGALIAHPDAIGRLRQRLPPFSLNIAAVRALEAALDDPGYLAWYVEQSRQSRSLIQEFCEARRWRCWPSEANFVLVRVGAGATALVAALAERGVLIRDRSRAPGCEGCVRITAGVVDHTRACLRVLEDVLASRRD